ncbi:IclR family transcriptional regulator [Agrobacterium sp. SHOUNA12C]|uniref:IclR family transcriptional regulator n=1 Tax=Rhizobium rhizogenes TaxID=359 RepID=UPI001574D046|nr:IclR family transcriptional regulator [Rhizobium rhizogenes]MCJ9719417.1 IclR family transcriptional regulator [Agrobacterium sp. BETTINA12B]MCJ9755733.1 IclR family transcriptional regulator [Agrobacterium sp. SHOUNA12C]NTF90408.1 IclR family transcriptional regulator [Rhizobium rhizogenes]
MSSLEDAVSILACFSLEEPAMTQAELTRRVGRPKATISRVMRSLRESGILEFEPTRRLYSPGLRLFELGQICRSNHNFLETVQKRLEDICRIGGHTGYISVFDGTQMVALRIVRGSSPLAIAAVPGHRVPLHATSSGRAMLALLSDREWRHRVPDPLPFVSPNSPLDHDALLERIQRIRTTGRSSASNETQYGVSSQGIALRDPESGEIIGVAISYPESMAADELKQMIGNLLDHMKSELTRRGIAI